MRSLEDFSSTDNTPLFKNATQLPPFFENNLVDPARVVKVFNDDPQANIRVFYYQYLKLCFELQNVDYEGYINKIEQILNNQDFKFFFLQEDDPSIFSDLQFKNLIMQFFGVLGGGDITVEQALVRYPVMDTILIYFFRAILILTGKADALDSYIERDDLVQYLCSYFSVDITFHDKCIKFVQTDIFVYEEDPKEVYMAYMDYDEAQGVAEVQESTGPSDANLNYFDEPSYEEPAHQANVNIHQEKTGHNGVQHLSSLGSHRGPSQINTSYISSDFVDYTSGNNNLTNLISPTSLKQSGNMAEAKGSSNTSKVPRKQSEDTSSKLVSSSNQVARTGSAKEVHESSASYTDTFTYSSQTNTNSLTYGSLNQKSSANNNTNLNYMSKAYDNHTNSNDFGKEKNKMSLQHEWEPTKDPGFDKIVNKNPIKAAYDYNIHAPTPAAYKPVEQPYKAPLSDSYKSFVTQPYKSVQVSGSSYKPPSPSIPSYKPQNIDYSSASFMDSFKKDPSKPSSYLSGVSESSHKYNQISKIGTNQNYTPSYQPPNLSPIVPSGKNPYNLNVSLEFTNSFTMKAMSQPYKTNVYNIRQKARVFRDSLNKFIK